MNNRTTQGAARQGGPRFFVGGNNLRKNKMKYRVLSALLAVLMCFTCMGSVSFAAESEPTEPSDPPATAETPTAESTPEQIGRAHV